MATLGKEKKMEQQGGVVGFGQYSVITIIITTIIIIIIIWVWPF